MTERNGAHRRARRGARSPPCGVRRRRDVHAQRRPHLAAVRGGPQPGRARRRHPPRAVGDVRRRGLRQADPAAGRRRADGRAGHHERRVGGDVGVVQRVAARRARRAGARSGAGGPGRCRSSTTCRSCVDHEVGGDGHRSGQGRAMVHEAIALAAEPHRGPVFLDFPLDVFGPSAGDVPAVDPAGGGRRCPTRTRSPRSPSSSPGRAAGVRRRQRRLLGRGVGRAGPRRRAPRVPVFTNGLGRGRCRPTTSWRSSGTRRLLKRGPTSSSCSARRSTSGSASGASAPPRSPTSSTPTAQRAAHVDVPTVAGDIAALAARPRRARRDRGRPRGVDRRAARRRGRGRAGEPLLAADAAPIKPTRDLRRAAQAAGATPS